MNKTERLIRLLKILNSDNKLSLKDISDSYNISERTVYRDLNTLSKLGYAINQEGGYNLEGDATEDDFDKFNATEIRLIVFALRTNILGKIFPFEDLADRIEKKQKPNLSED